VLRIPLVRGRAIEPGDRPDGAFVAIVNRAMANRFFPGDDPIGKSIRILGNKPRTIVGVVDDIRTRAFHTGPQPEIYIPHAQSPSGGMFLVIRTSSRDPARLAPAVRATLRALDPDLPIANLRTADQLITATLSAERFSLVLMSLFAAITLALSILGVYSVQSYAVAQRAKELGIRAALGARRRDLLHLVLRQGITPVVSGIIVGLAVAISSTTLLTKMLFEVSPTDPLTLAGAVFVLAATALAAAFVPARRAARLDPMTAMRQGPSGD
jgi:putative ABC transport system permease protein